MGSGKLLRQGWESFVDHQVPFQSSLLLLRSPGPPALLRDSCTHQGHSSLHCLPISQPSASSPPSRPRVSPARQPLSREGSWAGGGVETLSLTFPREVSSFQSGRAQLCWLLSRSKELSMRVLLFPQPKGTPFPVGPGLAGGGRGNPSLNPSSALLFECTLSGGIFCLARWWQEWTWWCVNRLRCHSPP